MKYIHHEDGKEEFYELTNDPKEKRNLGSFQSKEMLELKREYFEFLSESGAGGLTAEDSLDSVPPDLRDNLKALGYVD